jgi:hypothetical protein
MLHLYIQIVVDTHRIYTIMNPTILFDYVFTPYPPHRHSTLNIPAVYGIAYLCIGIVITATPVRADDDNDNYSVKTSRSVRCSVHTSKTPFSRYCRLGVAKRARRLRGRGSRKRAFIISRRTAPCEYVA